MDSRFSLTTRRWFLPAMIAAIVALLSLIGVSTAWALVGSPFEGDDGNLTVDSQVDWGNVSPTVGLDEPSGQDDDSFKGKEDDAVPDVVAGSIPKNKSDLQRFYVAHEKVAGTDFLYLAWVRSNILGTANMDFEFNQSNVISANGVTPVRTAGDLLVTFNLSSGETPVVGLSRWTDAGPCESASTGPCWSPIEELTGTGIAEGAVNGVDVYDPIADETLPALTFGEAAINLTDAGVFDTTSCVSFGSAYVKSRSSDAFTSSLKDFIKPIDISVSNCASVTIIKDAQPAAATAFDFETNLTGDGSTIAFQLDGDGGRQTFLDKFVGSYSVTELPSAADWDLTAIACDNGASGDIGTGAVTLNLGVGDSVTCTFTNVQRGHIMVEKVTVGGDAVFDFSLSGGPVGVSQSFSLGGVSAAHVSDALKPGTYAVTEAATSSEWDQTGATCSDGSDPAAIVLDPGETVLCTFTNTMRGHLIVNKVATPSDDPQAFDFSLSGGPGAISQPFSLSDGGSHDSGPVRPGAYAVSEAAVAGWDLESATCDDGSAVSSVSVDAGETVTCTFTNYKLARITIDKVTLPAGAPQAFDFSLTGGPSSLNQSFSLTDAGAPHDSGYVQPGSYAAEELFGKGPNAVSGWDLTGLDCTSGLGVSAFAYNGPAVTMAIGVGDELLCTFTNTQRGSIVIIKDAHPNDPQDFAFTLVGPESFSENFLLDDDGANSSNGNNLSNTKTFSEVHPGAYTVTEADAGEAWDPGLIECWDSSGTSVGAIDEANRTASFDLAPAETVTCTIHNLRRGILIVEKFVVDEQIIPEFDPRAQLFNYTTAGGYGFSLMHGETETIDLIPAGAYWVAESKGDGWGVTSSCDVYDADLALMATVNGGGKANFEMPVGGTVECTFTNKMELHPGSQGFWRNWDNHYTTSEFEEILAAAMAQSSVYDGLFVWDELAAEFVLADYAIAVIDDIYDFSGGGTAAEQKIMSEYTTLMLNLGVSKIEAIQQYQMHDDICLDCLIDVSDLDGAGALLVEMTGTLGVGGYTVGDAVAVVEGAWSGSLALVSAEYAWSFESGVSVMSEGDMWLLESLLQGLNQGWYLVVDHASYALGDPACLKNTFILPVGTVSADYSATITIDGGAPAVWSTSKAVPGLFLSVVDGELVLSGTPTAAGTYIFSISVSDVGASGVGEFTILINPAPAIATTALPGATDEVAYAALLEAVAGTGTGPLTWTVSGLPAGLDYDADTGEIFGAADIHGKKPKVYAIAVELTDANGATANATIDLTVNPA